MALLLDVIERLKAGAPLLVTVEKAESLQSIVDVTDESPAAFVHYQSESDRGAGNLSMGPVVTQDISRNIGVILASVAIVGDTEPFDDARRQILAALIGFKPPNAQDAMVWVGGEVIAEDGPLTWWRDVFAVNELKRYTIS